MKKILFSLFVAALSVFQATAQEYGVGTLFISDCGGFLVDPGMSAADYSPNFVGISVICSDASIPGQVNLDFNFFSLGAGDQLSIFNGGDASAPLIGTYVGTDLNGITVSSSNPSNCLTVLFMSDADASVGSFGAEISCGIPCEPPVVAVTVDQPDFQPTRLCVGESITFDASGTVFAPGSVMGSHTWDFDDGTTDVTSWPTVTHTFSESGAYMVELMVLDTNGCGNINLIDALILVDTEPSMSIIADDLQACLGQEVNLAVSIDPTYWTAIPTANLGGALYIPDDQSQCFSDTIFFGGFNAGQTIQNVSDLENFFINFEHSYMGDLVISFICPNGQSIIAHQQGGASTFLGEPIDINGPADPAGVGYDYFWSPAATAGTWVANSGVGTLPSGTYNTIDPFTNLIGCPLNGAWIVEVCDMFGSDDGWIFDWSVTFDSTLYPPLVSFLPSFGYTCDSISWSGAGISNTVANCGGAVLNPTTAGDYYIIASATDNFGCTFTDTIGVNYFAPPVLDLLDDTALCLDPIELTSSLTGQISGVNYVYEWSILDSIGGALTYNSDSTLATFSGGLGDAEILLSVHPETNSATCTVSDSITLDMPETPIDSTFSKPLCLTEQFNLSTFDSDAGNQYFWYNSTNPLDTLGVLSSFLTPIPPSDAVTVVYSLEVTENICQFKSVSEYTINYLTCEVILPNIININQDLYANDTLSFGDALKNFSSAAVQVFNRWGDLVYENSNYQNDWIPSEFSDGVYYYTLTVTTPTGTTEGFQGYFHLMRKSQ